jgi:hypothetical protein
VPGAPYLGEKAVRLAQERERARSHECGREREQERESERESERARKSERARQKERESERASPACRTGGSCRRPRSRWPRLPRRGAGLAVGREVMITPPCMVSIQNRSGRIQGAACTTLRPMARRALRGPDVGLGGLRVGLCSVAPWLSTQQRCRIRAWTSDYELIGVKWMCAAVQRVATRGGPTSAARRAAALTGCGARGLGVHCPAREKDESGRHIFSRLHGGCMVLLKTARRLHGLVPKTAIIYSARICSTRFTRAIGGRCIGTIGMVYPGTLVPRRQRGIPMHSYENRSQIRARPSYRHAHRKALGLEPFLCLITPLCSYLYGGLYGGCMREHL